MNNENLIPCAGRLKCKDLAQKAGIASGKARRELKEIRERLLMFAEQPIKTDDGKELPRVDVIALQLITRACAGDLKAIRLYAELTGQLTQQVELQQAVPVIVRDDGLD